MKQDNEIKDAGLHVETNHPICAIRIRHEGDYFQPAQGAKRIAAGAYGVVSMTRLGRMKYWGYGGVRDTTSLFAHGIAAVLEDMRDEIDTFGFCLHVLCKGSGLEHMLDVEIPRLNARGGFNVHGQRPEALDQWNKVLAVWQQNKLSIAPKGGRISRGLSRQAMDLATEYSKLAYEREAFRRLGPIVTGREPARR